MKDYPARTRCRSYSLLELLLVVTLLAGILVIVMSGYAVIVRSTAVSTGADLIGDAFTEAHDSAVAQNTTVEVRLYDVSQDNGTPAYTALQLRWLKSDGTTPAVALPVFLPPGVAIDATSMHSPLIGSNTNLPPADTTDARINANTRVFHFYADGSTDLNSATNWFLTVRSAALSDPGNFPANWASVAVDPNTGRVQLYRP